MGDRGHVPLTFHTILLSALLLLMELLFGSHAIPCQKETACLPIKKNNLKNCFTSMGSP